MLLSEAIRLGAMLGPQLYRKFCDTDGATCAMGAALSAVGAIVNTRMVSMPEEAFPGILRPVNGSQIRPVGLRAKPCDIWREITYRNNDLRHTREQIADWLVESGNDCASVETAPAQEIAAALVTAHMEAQ